MVLSPQAERAWKLGTAIITSFTAFHAVFRVDYGDHDHVFTGIQAWYRRKVDEVLLGGINTQNHEQNTQNNQQLHNSINSSNLPKQNNR